MKASEAISILEAIHPDTEVTLLLSRHVKTNPTPYPFFPQPQWAPTEKFPYNPFPPGTVTCKSETIQ
jgi:hypothetical protein